MRDLTIIFLTANKVPKKWAEFQKETLLKAVGDTRIITISYIPLDWGDNILQTEYSVPNIYRQILRGAKMADTEYVAIAEDDTLYPASHFTIRPEGIGYNLNRWIIFTWVENLYFHKPNGANGTMIAKRKDLIAKLGGIRRKEIEGEGFYTRDSIICFNHDYSVDDLQQRHHKMKPPVTAYDIPLWDRAEDLRNKFI